MCVLIVLYCIVLYCPTCDKLNSVTLTCSECDRVSQTHMQYACLQCVVIWNLSANVCMCSVKAVVSHAVAMSCSVSLYMCSYSTSVWVYGVFVRCMDLIITT